MNKRHDVKFELHHIAYHGILVFSHALHPINNIDMRYSSQKLWATQTLRWSKKKIE